VQIPDNIDDIRQKLFDVKLPILLNSQQIADYWPHTTNVWMRHTKIFPANDGTRVEEWECRHKNRVTKKFETRETSGAWQSKRALLRESDSKSCPIRLRMSYFIRHADNDENHKGGIFRCNCLPERMYLERSAKSGEAHNHDMEVLDTFKRSDAMMYFVKNKAEEGYSFAAVTNWLHKNFDSMTSQAQRIGKQGS